MGVILGSRAKWFSVGGTLEKSENNGRRQFEQLPITARTTPRKNRLRASAKALGSGRRPQFFFFQAEDGIRAGHVTGVQTCALPIYTLRDTTAAFACSICQRPSH